MRAEEALRARGLTGARAFEELLLALRHHLGEPVRGDLELMEILSAIPRQEEVDLLGLAWERFFPDLFKGLRGQFFTPRPLVELLLQRLGPLEGLDVLDPTCGSGTFLVCAGRRGARVRGLELDPQLAELAGVNLRLARLPGQVRQADFFAAQPAPAQVVVANPPFSVEIRDPGVLERYQIAQGRDRALSDWLFVEALERWVVPGGRAAVVLPWSILTNQSWAPLRERVQAHWERLGLCGLPEGVFRPFGGAAGRAVLLWLQRRPCPPAVTTWARLRDPGYDVRSRHLRPTTDAEVQALAQGQGWTELPRTAWFPEEQRLDGRPARSLLSPAGRSVRPSRHPERAYAVVDLADTNKATGEVVRATPASGAELKGARVGFEAGQILVSRLRPELGNVAMARHPVPEGRGELVGSGEWIVLDANEHAHATLLALRTPAWRAQLALTGGQTRPRTNLDAVLDSRVPLPKRPELVQRIDTLAASLHQERAALRARLEALQRALDDFAQGEIDESELEARVEALS